MPNRVRILCSHPDYGLSMGSKAFCLVERRFKHVNSRRTNSFVQPKGFVEWPRWKRCLWMVKRMGGSWRFQVFREPRRTKAERSAFWKAARTLGFATKRNNLGRIFFGKPQELVGELRAYRMMADEPPPFPEEF